MVRKDGRLPEWFKVSLPAGKESARMHQRLSRLGLNTVCESARCPNQAECWGCGTATVMIMGDVCTRGCRFCNVKTGHPLTPPSPDEPARVAEAVADASLKYVVLTSVDRDDVADGGASHFASTISAVKAVCPGILVEALIPDYRRDNLATVIKSDVDVLGHNIEVVRRITPSVRDRRASYENSLAVLAEAREFAASFNRKVLTKSSIMVGVGETDDEVAESLADLAAVGVSIVTIGQYLQPTAKHLPVDRYVTPDQFDRFKVVALEKGILFAASGPLVRSSYKAAELFAMKLKADNRD
jgi:lipoic acid synthetase